MHSLLPPEDSKNKEGCQILFPDTAFYDPLDPQPGMANDIIKTDTSTGFLTVVTDKRRL